jgi:hypothetical protein
MKMTLLFIFLFILSSSSTDIEKRYSQNIILSYLSGSSSSSVTTQSIVTRHDLMSSQLMSDTIQITIDLSDYTLIQCQSVDDYIALLYNLCTKSTTCCELFYLTQDSDENITSFHYEKNLKRFAYQITTANFFILINGDLPEVNNTSSSSTIPIVNISTKKPFIMQESWPTTLFPNFIFQIPTNTSTTSLCQSLAIQSSDNRTLFYITQLLLLTYKMFVVNENYCSNPNEVLKMDENYKFHCECKLGKDCDNDSNFEKATIGLLISLMVLEIILIVALFVSSNAKLEKLSLVTNKHKLE